MGLANALNNRPVRVLGFIAAYHSIMYGIGLFFGVGGFENLVLALALVPGLVLYGFCAALVGSGGLLMFAYARNNPKTIKNASTICGLTWLFATFVYILAGSTLLGLTIGVPWALFAFYTAYAHSNRVEIIAYDQTREAIEDTENEDQL